MSKMSELDSDDEFDYIRWWSCLSRKVQDDIVSVLDLETTGHNELTLAQCKVAKVYYDINIKEI